LSFKDFTTSNDVILGDNPEAKKSAFLPHFFCAVHSEEELLIPATVVLGLLGG
jgi:hypothetical protein